jgi:hypothetical protein
MANPGFGLAKQPYSAFPFVERPATSDDGVMFAMLRLPTARG